MLPFAAVAQLVEQRIRNAKVASSIPASGTTENKGKAPVMNRGFSFVCACISTDRYRTETSLQVLHLLAHLLDQQFKLHRRLRDFADNRF